MALFDAKSLVGKNRDSIKYFENIKSDKKAIVKHARSKAALKKLVTELKANTDWPGGADLLEKIANEKEVLRDNVITIYDFFIKSRDFDRASTFLPMILSGETRNESIFNKLKKTLALKGGLLKKVGLDDQDLWHAGRVIQRQPQILLKLPQVRSYLARRRRRDLIRDIYKLKAKDGKYSIENTVIHNLETMDRGADDGARTELLLGPLLAIDDVRKHSSTLKVLTIGPRSESEIFSIWAAGFNPDNVRGVDLISYTPLIDEGDMHELPFDDGEFDVIIAGWVLAYSNNNKLAASEIMRVAADKAYIAVGCAYSPPERNEAKITGTNINPTRFSTVEDITVLFESRLDRVMFYGEPAVEADKATGAKQVSTIMRMK